MGVADKLVVRGYFTRRSVTDASLVLFSWDIMVGLLVGRDVFVDALCIGCL